MSGDSLPDRVEAAYLEAWRCGVHVTHDSIERILAAADACEAERTPPTDVARRLHEIEKELAVGARDEARCYLTYAEARFLVRELRSLGEMLEAERNPTTDEYEQVGWYFDDEWTPERMSRSEWESERLVTSRAVDDEDGLAPPWDERAKPVFVRRAVSSEDVPNREQREAIADEVIAERTARFTRSLEIECPECEMPPGQPCIVAGGSKNHMARIDAAVSSEDVHREAAE